MARKNTILFSMIIVVIILAYLWLTDSNQWNQSDDHDRLTQQPLTDNEHITPDEYHTLKVTSLAPPNDKFNGVLRLLHNAISINTEVEYFADEDYSYNQYIDALLTEESGEIHLIPNEWVLPLAVQGYLMPLDRVLTSEYTEEQTLAMMESLKWNSSIWATPLQINPFIVIPHQSLDTYFTQAEEQEASINTSNEILVVNETEIVDNQEDENVVLAESGEDKLKDEDSNLANDSLINIVDSLINQYERDFKLVNASELRIDELFHFLHAYEGGGIASPDELSVKQLELLKVFQQEPELISYQSINEMIVNDESFPLFLVLTWDDLMKHHAFIGNHYIFDQALVPIHWANGFSFVIKQQTEQHQLAGQWLESLHREMSIMNQTIMGMPIHNSNLTRLQLLWQKSIVDQFNDHDTILNVMKVSTQWPIQFERVDEQWKIANVNEKLTTWIDRIQ